MCPSKDDTIIHGLEGVKFWGAQTYMYVNIVHFFACAVVVIIYCSMPKANKNFYNRAVLQHNVSLLLVGGILALLGLCQLTDSCPFNDLAIRLLWLSLQYFTNATVFWLNAVSFDVTLMISRLCWISASEKRDDEDRKLLVYALAAYGGALLPTITAGLFEFAPQIAHDYWLKANFTEAANGPRPIVNMYFFLLPACTLFCNNLLFVVTTYNIVRVQRSTELATENQKVLLRERYFLFLRLYVLMGAPWFFGAVLACLNRLALLKVCRTMQPVLWMIVLASRAKIVHRLTKSFACCFYTEGNASESKA